MSDMLRGLCRGTLYRIKKILKTSSFGQQLLYDVRSTESFTQFYNHERMLADSIRMNFYYNGIKRNIMPGDIIVDLGTGTGILSFLAAQQKPEKIYAIDQSDFINVARSIAEYNNIKDIVFIKTNSRNFNSNEKVDVILHEQIGHGLFDENMVANILDLKKRLLKENGKILPGKFELFIEPVCLKREYKVPFIWENNIYGIDFQFLKNIGKLGRYESAGYLQQFIDPFVVDYFLCEPESCMSFDLNELNDEKDIPKIIETSKRVIQPGSMDGLCIYFRAGFDEEVTMDTSPLHTRTHWMNILFRTGSKHYNVGEAVSFRFSIGVPYDRETWSFEIYSK